MYDCSARFTTRSILIIRGIAIHAAEFMKKVALVMKPNALTIALNLALISGGIYLFDNK